MNIVGVNLARDMQQITTVLPIPIVRLADQEPQAPCGEIYTASIVASVKKRLKEIGMSEDVSMSITN